MRRPPETSPLKDRAAKDGAVLDVTVVLLDGGYASEAIGPMEVFHSAGWLWNSLQGEKPQPRFRVRAASVDGGAVMSLCGLGLEPQLAIRDVKHADLILVPAANWDGQQQIAARNAPLLPWIRKWHARGAYVAGVCTGVGSLAESGILDGRLATTHWAVADSFRERYPKVRWQPEQLVTEDGNVFCGGGIYAALDLSLYLVEKFCGHEVAVKSARSLLLNMPRSRQSGYSIVPLARPHTDSPIREIEEFLQDHFVRGASIEALAERARMSPRNFIRRFKAATGRMPGEYLQALRMASARDLLENGRIPIGSIAAKVGYEDAAFFRALFRRHTGITPAEYRSRFGSLMLGRGDAAREESA